MYFTFHIRAARLTVALRKLASLLVALIVFATPQAWAGTNPSGVQEMAGKITGYGSSIPQQPAVSDLWKAHRTCRYYAKKAIQDQIKNLTAGCGYSGVRWRLDFTNHYSWCIAANSRSRNFEINTRSSALSNCPKGDFKTKPDAGICSTYANLAIAQQQDNKRLKCSISGSSWHSNYDNHYNLCMRTKSVKNVEQKTNKRQGILAKCAEYKEHNPCNTFANRAVQDGVANQRVSCGGTGERWQIDWNAQYAWCRAATIEGRTHETTARRDAIAQCFKTGVMGDPVACRAYATDGVAHWRTNLARCSRGGFRGKYWHGDYNKHYSWCIGVRASAHEYINEFRIGRLALCTSGNPKPVICNLYANTAIAQQRTNQSQGCGFAGEQWHLDANRHKNWCMAATEKARSNVSNARINALARCTAPGGTVKAKTCSEYANSAIAQQRINQSQGCGFAGEQWHLDANRHKNWCMGVSPQTSSNATNGRNNSLKRCSATGGKAKICVDYANHAILQQRTNLRVKCGFTGGNWHLNFNNHKSWCMGVSAQTRQNLTNARSNALAQCTSPGGTGRAVYCRKYTNQSVAQQQTNLRVQCGYSGAQWHLDANRHEKWCNSAQIGLPAAQAKARQDALAQCTSPSSTGKAKIRVVSATYGGNCGVATGNVTMHIAKQCNGKSKCRYTVDHKIIGDPTYGCAKTYVVRYRCGSNPQTFAKSLTAEAGFGDKAVFLECVKTNTQQPVNPGSPGLGRVWNVDAEGWIGTWTRRGSSNLFDGVFTRGRSRVTDLVAISIQGNRVTVQRKHSSDRNLCTYSGNLSANGRSVKGTYTCQKYPGSRFRWTANISSTNYTPGSASLGSVWSEVEAGIKGTWTRRGNTNTFDGRWENGAIAVLEMSINGNKVTIRRHDPAGVSAGFNITYEGVISTDGKSVSGKEYWPGGIQDWSAAIR